MITVGKNVCKTHCSNVLKLNGRNHTRKSHLLPQIVLIWNTNSVIIKITKLCNACYGNTSLDVKIIFLIYLNKNKQVLNDAVL